MLHPRTIISSLTRRAEEVGSGGRVDDGDVDESEIVREVELKKRPRSGGSKKQGIPSLLAVSER